MKPNGQHVLVTEVHKHGVNTVCHSHLIVICPYTELEVRIDVDVRYVNLGLVVVDIVNLLFVKHQLVFIDLNILFVLRLRHL